MKWFLNLTTRSKLFVGFGLMIVFLATVIVTAYLGISALQASQKSLYQADFANALDLMNLRSNQNGVRAAQLTMMVVSDRPDRERWRQDADDRRKEIETTMRSLLDRGRHDPSLLARLEELKAIQDAFEQTRATQLNPLIFAGKIEEAKTLALGIQAERYGRMRAISTELGNAAAEKARASVADSELKAQQTVSVFIIVGIMALLLAVTMALLLNRVIALPLLAVSGIAERVASGDLTVNIPEDHRADEVGTLVRGFRALLENLRAQTRQLVEGANVLGAAASEIVASTTQLASSASESAAAVSETTTTVEEVRQTAQVASQKAKYVADSAQKAAQISQSGRKSTEDVGAGMTRIRQQMDAIAASMGRLSEQSQTIGQIIATVEDLAAQSNLLAVNAAIEAAKAGEHGKGFGVVAQEVKSLAEQSRQATTQVRTILSDIQKATTDAVLAT
ncbi:MAG: hypothetical protein A3G27_11710 [Betaproteobacteria bacterium RIFCSPLOWO2_12_FULL_66_14]|nr:MAG: hypothetical protein A3G27_11710 [Betaproteobacteria bacterium RIFCSPLOWO2_12_FULL_66_14]